MLITVLMSSAYVAAALLNGWVLASLEYASGVHWIYVPAGLRMCFALVMPIAGPVAIGLGSFVLSLQDHTHTWVTAMVNGVVTGTAPWLARKLAMRRYAIEEGLSNLTALNLLRLSLFFGLLSSSFHQAWYALLGREMAGITSGWLPMFIGDTAGAIVCLYIFKGILIGIERWASPAES